MLEPGRIACFATQGSGSLDESRIVALLEHLSPTVLPFDRAGKQQSSSALVKALRDLRPELVVMEGSGIGGGAAVIRGKTVLGIPYVVSSGDAIAPFWALRRRGLRLPGHGYERLLLGLSAGYIGWSPYLVGRALTLGAPRAMTAANWAPVSSPGRRNETRARLGIPAEAVVFGLVGSLAWNSRVRYSYGLELVQAVRRVERVDVRVLVVGDGNGLSHLRSVNHDRRVLLTGHVPREDVPDYLAAMDIASLPQSVDGIGSFRYTTKLSEYTAAGLPIVTSRGPLAYDLDTGWIWRLPGTGPWDETYVAALARLMDEVQLDEVARRRGLVERRPTIFNKELQQRRVSEFISELVADGGRRSGPVNA